MQFEALTLLISGVSLVVAATAAIVSWRTSRKQIDLQRTTDELARKQLEQISASENYANSADVRASLVPNGRHTHRLMIQNIGLSDAYEVWLECTPRGKGVNPVMMSDYEEKFPLPVLNPGSSVGVLTTFDSETAIAVDVVIHWKNPDAKEAKRDAYVAL